MEIGDIVLYREKGMAENIQDCPALVLSIYHGEEHPNLDLQVFTPQGSFHLMDIRYDESGSKDNTWRFKKQQWSWTREDSEDIFDQSSSEESVPQSISSSTAAEESE